MGVNQGIPNLDGISPDRISLAMDIDQVLPCHFQCWVGLLRLDLVEFSKSVLAVVPKSIYAKSNSRGTVKRSRSLRHHVRNFV